FSVRRADTRANQLKFEDTELGSIRIQFVAKVSGELIKQLLDDLLDDGILNDGEKDSILESNNSRADRARCLIDTVKRKGREASKKMIAHLQERDPTLFTELGLPPPV
uniref:CARD domain-containing protein n=1 Tax=Anabas testudineus TaxID=64144 RepID=A0AAQ6IJZ0_ANATE